MTTKNQKDVILLNCQEVPETVCVETRFTTNLASKQIKYDQLYCITSTGNFEIMAPENEVVPAKSIAPLPKQTITPVGPVQQCQLSQVPGTMAPFGTSVTNLNKNNPSAVQNLNLAALMASNNYLPFQTVIHNINNINTPREKSSVSDIVKQVDVTAFNKKSVAIQCKLDDEIEDLEVEWPEMIQDPLESPTSYLENEKDEFLKYVLENSTQHKTCKECLICGEICKSNKYFYGHMAIHQGPKMLCYKCGKNLDNEKLFFKHKCRKAQQLENAFMQCPHHNCSVKAISPLELFDHINEHADNRIYKCLVCRKRFCTSQEYLRHLLIRAKCYTGAKRKRFSFYGLQSQRDRSCRVRVFTLHTYKKSMTLVKTFLSKRVAKQGFCKICLRYFANKYVYSRHRIKCIGKFRKRLIRKKN